jgi:tetratricopeptide (TPR) repeat protein
MNCPGEEIIVAFAQGALDPDGVARVEAHLDACADCMTLVSELARKTHDKSTPDPASAPVFRRGDAVGRYVVLDWIGAGAMGVVYAAYDPRLDRKVALKLLRSVGDAEERGAEGERLEAEARALAKVSHPNIVAVHDVGTAMGGVFLALEFVEGTTLAAWLADAPRAMPAILDTFVAAGRGLAAAHRAGLVHRDFKPENVLLGKDGRVRVADFGLARAQAMGAVPLADDAAEATHAPPAKDAKLPPAALTSTGLVVGTPAYMAPEQYDGRNVDARADQFSFAVALYEAVYGERPFAGRTMGELSAEVRTGRIRDAPKGTSVPAALRRALVKGLAPAPADRHASMDALLHELTKSRAARRRRVVTVLAAAIVVGGGAAALRLGRAPTVCRGSEKLLDGVWDAAKKDELHLAFVATRAPYAEDAWRGAARALDAYAHRWTAYRTEACEATRVRGEQSEELLDRRMVCLGERLDELGSVTRVLSHADTDVVRNAVAAAEALTNVEVCSAAANLGTRVKPPAPGIVRDVTAARAELSRAKALRDTGKYGDARAVAEAAERAASGVGYAPLEGEALYRLGELEGLTGDGRRAEDTLFRAARTADAALDDRTRARALAELLYVGSMNKPGWMPFYRDESAAAIARLGDDVEIDALRSANLVVVLRSRGELDLARAEAERAIDLASRLGGPEGHLVAIGIHNLAGVLMAKGEYGPALASFERALALTEKTLGSSHPNVVRTLSEICEAYYLERLYAEARARCARALEIGTRVMPPDHSSMSDLLDNDAAVANALGAHEQALAEASRALAIREKQFGPSHKKLLYPLTRIGKAEIGLSRPESAVATLERALAVAGDAPPEDRAEAEFALARALAVGDKDRARALSLATKASAEYAAFGPTHAEDRREVDDWLRAHRPQGAETHAPGAPGK